MSVIGYVDLAGNDLNGRFAPYVSGATGTLTGYVDLAGNDLNSRFAPYIVPAFPTAQSSIPGMGNYNTIDVDGANCVVATQGGLPAGDTYTYLYWSDDYCATLNRATIDGNANVKFFGVVAISGQYAIAMGRLTQAGTNNFYLSSDYGKTYTVTPAASQPAGGSASVYAMLNMSGANAVWSVGGVIYYSTNYGANWATNGLGYSPVALKMYGNTVFSCSVSIGFWYSTNGGQSFTQNTNIGGGVNSVVQVGTTIYVAGLGVMYKLSSPSSTVLNTITNPGGMGNYIITIAGCKTDDGYDFVLFSSDSGSMNYTNNGGVSFETLISTGYLGHSLFTNSTRIISATRTNSLYWGRNAYIKNALPLAIASCCLWLDATDTSTITLASTKVASWTDKSTNAFVFNQTTVGSRPTYTINSQNSLATLTFDATNSTYLLGPSNFSIGTSSYSLFVVCNITAPNASSCGIFNKSKNTFENGRIIMLQDGGLINISYNHPGNAYMTASSTYTVGNYRIFELIVNRTEGKDYAYQNGTLLATLTISDATNYTDSSNNMIIGAYPNSTGREPFPGYYMSGNIAEVLSYKGIDLTTTKRETAEGYLAWKWGIQTFLPSYHTYRYYRPNTFPPPLTIPGCCLWLDATDTSTITLASTKVASWRDKSSNAFVFNQATAGLQPTYTLNGRNTLPTLTFTRTSSTHLVGPTNFSIGTSSYSLFVVCNITATNATSCGIFNKSLFGAVDGRIIMLQDSNAIAIQYAHTSNRFLATTTASYTAGNYRILELIVNRTEGKDYAYQNGTLLSTLTITDATNYTDTIYPMLIGAYNNGSGTGPYPGYYLSGNVAEIISYKGADITPTNRQNIEGYLAWKWEIQTFLPTAHPYRNVAPTF